MTDGPLAPQSSVRANTITNYSRENTMSTMNEHHQMSEHGQSRKPADKSMTIANKTFEKGRATVEQSSKAVEQSYWVTVENIRAVNVKMVDMTRANVEAVLDFSLEIATAKAPSDIVELWTTHAHKQFEMLSEQTKELAALAQKMAGEGAETVTRSFNQVFKNAS